MAKLIKTELSTQVLKFKPGGAPVSFEATVTNSSTEFATFQLDLVASGVDPKANTNWYRLAPDVSARIPAGDRARFVVSIRDVPPIPGGFTGTMTLTVRVFSLELREEDRQVVNLIVEGTGVLPPKLDLPIRKFQGYPGDQIEIPVSVFNPNRQSASITLRITGLDAAWLLDGTERRLQIPPGGSVDAIFLGQLPPPGHAPSQVYRFAVEAIQAQATMVRLEANLTVLPMGFVDFRCHPPQHWIPARRWGWGKWKADTAAYDLQFDNQSNLEQQVSVKVQPQDSRWQHLINLGSDRAKARRQALIQSKLTIIPEQATLKVGEVNQLQLVARQQRPWWGWVRQSTFEVQAVVSDARLDLRNDTQTLKLNVLPLIPVWLQLILGLLLIGLLSFSQFAPAGHQAPVSAIQFNGLANEVVSGSKDQTIRRWQVHRHKLRPMGILEQADKAVRVVRYRPVNNDWIAAGFENGQTQVFNLLSGQQQAAFGLQKDDRVLDLVFTQDARSLFSGHGSGKVAQWRLQRGTSQPNLSNQEPVRERQVDFAVEALALVGEAENHLAIAGRFNRLLLWDLVADTLRPLPYKPGSKDHYIVSLSTAKQRPDMLATADNQGNISVWNLNTCLQGTLSQGTLSQGTLECQPLDQWSNGHGGKPVHAVALSADACYLASAGEDGRVMLWTLQGSSRQVREGKALGKFSRSVNTVDVVRTQDEVLVASGGDDRRVRLYRSKDSNPTCQ